MSLRLSIGYAHGLRRQAAEAIVGARNSAGDFSSTEDLALHVPLINRKEITLLARIGALNSIDGVEHRRDALWQVERAGKPEGPLLRQQSEWLRGPSHELPLATMTDTGRLIADYCGTGITVGRHPMQYRRETLRKHGVLSAADLQQPKRRMGALGRLCDRAPEAKYNHRVSISLDGRRVGHHEHDRLA